MDVCLFFGECRLRALVLCVSVSESSEQRAEHFCHAAEVRQGRDVDEVCGFRQFWRVDSHLSEMIDLAHHFCHAMKIADQARGLRHAQAPGTSVKRRRCRGLRKRGRYVRVRPSLRVRAHFGLAQFGEQRQQQKQDENIGISVHNDVPLGFSLFLGYHMKILRAWCIN